MTDKDGWEVVKVECTLKRKGDVLAVFPTSCCEEDVGFVIAPGIKKVGVMVYEQLVMAEACSSDEDGVMGKAMLAIEMFERKENDDG